MFADWKQNVNPTFCTSSKKPLDEGVVILVENST
jgi:hypothetical protein